MTFKNTFSWLNLIILPTPQTFFCAYLKYVSLSRLSFHRQLKIMPDHLLFIYVLYSILGKMQPIFYPILIKICASYSILCHPLFLYRRAYGSIAAPQKQRVGKNFAPFELYVLQKFLPPFPLLLRGLRHLYLYVYSAMLLWPCR